MLAFCAGGPPAMLVILALWLAEFGVLVSSSNVAWQENIRPKMYVQLGEYCQTSAAPFRHKNRSSIRFTALYVS
jgi:hypothetical protein